MDVRLASQAVLGMCNSVAAWYRPNGDFGPDEIAEQFGELAVRALSSLTEPGADRADRGW